MCSRAHKRICVLLIFDKMKIKYLATKISAILVHPICSSTVSRNIPYVTDKQVKRTFDSTNRIMERLSPHQISFERDSFEIGLLNTCNLAAKRQVPFSFSVIRFILHICQFQFLSTQNRV